MEDRPIQRLCDEVIGMIAAGEVVENPASAIKEMVENSLDAQANAITVEIRDGGVSYIRVSDNGKGIRRKDIRMAFERHATSKIVNSSDLYDLHTLGFRGEALASIAAVSKVTLTTRTQEEMSGLRAVNEGGFLQQIQEAASPRGTTIVVRDLFYNTPVRLKFLKKPTTEAAKVSEVIARFILSRPEVSFRFISNGKQVYASTGNGDLRSALFSLYGRETAEHAIRVSLEGAVSISGFVGVGDEARSSRNRQTFIVNGRQIRSPLLSAALEEGCRERVTVGHHPLCVLLIDLPPTMVDVNVHPNKLEVRFSDERMIYGKVLAAIAESFPSASVQSAPNLRLSEPEIKPVTPASLHVLSTASEPGLHLAKVELSTPTPPNQEHSESISQSVSALFAPPTAPFVDFPKPTVKLQEAVTLLPHLEQLAFSKPLEPSSMAAPASPESAASSSVIPSPERTSTWFDSYRLVGVLFDTYILLQNQQQALLIDQHAAHERILYERMMHQIDIGKGSQQLLVPQIVHVTPQDRDCIETYREEIAAAGYEFTEFGDQDYQIRAVPVILGDPEGKGAFLDLVDHLAELRVLSTRQKRRDAILQMACKKAIKGGDRISQSEIFELLRSLEGLDSPPTCPHGRPLVVTLSRTEIEKRFKRINN